MRADGTGEPRQIADNAFQPAWSPDGKKIAFGMEERRGYWTIRVVNADGSNNVLLRDAGGSVGSPSWSPDGRSIAFDQFVDPERQQIFVMDSDGSGARQLTRDPNWSCSAPSWPPDGKRIVFAARSADKPCGRGFSSTGHPMPECTRRIFVIEIDGSRPPVMVTSVDAAAPAFSPATARM